jgi:endonuclease/exonuclease/phosphatase family metal-dependent hydrolase
MSYCVYVVCPGIGNFFIWDLSPLNFTFANMKRILLSFFLLIALESMAQQPLNVMSFNIRLNIASDSLNSWPYRKDKVSSQVLFHEVHLLGVQEALHNQMIDLSSALPQYKFAGVGRDDGKTKGEYSAIFYDTVRLQLLETKTFWLSTTPEVPGSKSWDAAITRVVTWGKFRDKRSKKVFYAFNTHFDHMGVEARKESAKLLKKRVKEIVGSIAVIIMGDFNSRPADEPIQIVLDKNDPDRFVDTKDVSITPHYGPTGTFNGFRSREVDEFPIDYIFIKGKWKVLQHATLSQTWGGRFSSDHFPLFARLIL